MTTKTEQFLQETAEVLKDNILDFWLTLRDPRGGFYGEVLSSGEIQADAPRGVILNARIMWTFAAAWRRLRNPAYREAAEQARDWFLDHFFDPVYSGVYWSVTAAGEPMETKKQLYAQGFGIVDNKTHGGETVLHAHFGTCPYELLSRGIDFQDIEAEVLTLENGDIIGTDHPVTVVVQLLEP